MTGIVTANLGRGVGAGKFRRNAARVILRGALIGFQEIDEADLPREHRILSVLLKGLYRRVAWSTKVPIAVHRASFRVLEADVFPASRGVPRQSPRRVVVEAVVKRRGRRGIEFAVINVHWPRRSNALAAERRAVAAVVENRIAHHHEEGRSVLVTADANGWNLLTLHRRARRIGGRGIDWIVAVEHPRGVQFKVKGTQRVPLNIDGHDGYVTRLSLARPRGRR